MSEMNRPPGPKTFLEYWRMIVLRKQDPLKFYEETFAKYGDIVYFKLGPYTFVMLNDADAFEQVLLTDAKNFTKSTGYQRFKLVLGDGLLISEGEKWKKQRRLLSWAFSTKHIEKIHPLMVKETLGMMKRWEGKEKFDLAEEMNILTLEIISKSLFGRSQLGDSKDVRAALQDIIKYLQTTRHLWIQLMLAPFPIKDKRGFALKIESSLPTKKAKSFFGSIKILDQLVHSMIEERRRLKESSNFLDTLINATDSEDQSQMDNQLLRDEVVSILVAGHETTANALTWTWHLLLKYPDTLKKIREEIKQVVQGPAPSFEEIAKLDYTKAVLEESMRLYPPFWRISRKNLTAMKLQGYDIPAHSSVITAIYTIQRSAKYWEDPQAFKPERFLGDKEHHRFAFIPFGAGPRACVGSQFATVEALTILAICIKNYDFVPDFTGEPEFLTSITLQPKDGCKVKVKKASA